MGVTEADLHLYQYVGNNPVVFTDSMGASWAGKLGKKLVTKLLKGRFGREVVRANTVEEAVALAREGEQFIACSSKDVATEAKRRMRGFHEVDKKTGTPHFHDASRTTHFLYSAAGLLTFAHYAPGDPKAEFLDLVNPLSLGQDLLDIGEMVYEALASDPTSE